MNEAWLEAFRHNAWATKTLLSACRGLSDEQLGSSATGTYGDILSTFNHIVTSDGGYLRRLTDSGPDWVLARDASADLGQLEARVDETLLGWERFFSQPVDSERLILLNDGAYEAHASVLIAQALHHGNAHREQICVILTDLGIDPPDIQVWAYAEAKGLGRERVAE